MVSQLFAEKTIPEIPLWGHIKYFLELWKILTKDLSDLSVVQRYKTLLTSPHQINMPKKQPIKQSRDTVGKSRYLKNVGKGKMFVYAIKSTYVARSSSKLYCFTSSW